MSAFGIGGRRGRKARRAAARKADALSYRCEMCGRAKCRLYRSYGSFFRREELRCNAHVPALTRGWWVPLITDANGGVWGYTSAPEADIDRWRDRKDARPSPQWTGRGWIDDYLLARAS